jgi:cytoskeletal protein CcmA (bactofilin family)
MQRIVAKDRRRVLPARADFVIDLRILSARNSASSEIFRLRGDVMGTAIANVPPLDFHNTGAHMEQTAEIGASVVIKGDVTAREDIVISGRVEWTVSVEEFSVTIRPGANLEADIDARAVIVGGEIAGTLTAAECIELQRTARVQGEIVAAVLRLDDGAVFNGKAQTTKPRAASKLQLAS